MFLPSRLFEIKLDIILVNYYRFCLIKHVVELNMKNDPFNSFNLLARYNNKTQTSLKCNMVFMFHGNLRKIRVTLLITDEKNVCKSILLHSGYSVIVASRNNLLPQTYTYSPVQ